MPKGKVFRVMAVLVALWALSHPVVQLIVDLGAFASDVNVGTRIDAATGDVLFVRPGSNAASAGLKSGERVDFARTGPLMHLWLWDGDYPVGKPVALPVLRNGRPVNVTIVATAPPLSANLITSDVLTLIFAIVVMVLACTAVFGRVDSLTLAFYAFCVNAAVVSSNIAWLEISSPALTPLTALESSINVTFGIGLIYLCLRFPTGEPIGKWRTVDRLIPAYGVLIFLVYYLHFYQSAYMTGDSSSLYVVNGALVVLGALVGLVAYVARFREARGPDLTRMRWVAAAVSVYIASLVIFFFDQTVTLHGTPWVLWFFAFNPAAFAFAYALVQGHVIDIRIAGGRAVIYALVTSIPVALLAFADWLFAKRLEDARLATVFEVGIALGFSFWLRALHKRIDRFAERVFFASRHRAFGRIHQLTQALPFTEKIVTIGTLITEEAAAAMRFSSAALFRSDDAAFARTTAIGWDGAAEVLDGDDPIVLFARSAHHGVHLSEIPASKAQLPGGERKPIYALPIVVGRRVIAVVLYGGHRDGQAIDAEEEHLLTGLAHAAATAYEHLHAIERERENAMLRAELAALTPAPAPSQ